MTNTNTAGVPCPRCGGSGWTLHFTEEAHDGLEPAYRICRCEATGGARSSCERPGCGEAIPEGPCIAGATGPSGT